jgi:Icc-related predicted phosphoesterase
MKVLFFSDVHGDMGALSSLKAKAKQADICVCAGDFTTMEKNIQPVMNALDGFGKPVLMIHGNHEDEDRVKELCDNHENLTFLHKAVHHVDDYVFMGYGGDGFSTNDPDFLKVAGKFFKKEAAGKRRIIFVTHGPAYDTKIDMLGREPRGNKSYRQFIDDVQPHLAISGHLHENAGKHHKIGRTLFLNPGKAGAFVDI